MDGERVGPNVDGSGSAEASSAVPPAAVAFPDSTSSAKSRTDPSLSKQSGRGYFVRHWRGEIALGYSFWGGAAVVCIAGFVMGFILALRSVNLAPRLYASLFLAASAIMLAMGVWQLVGNWRSAGRRILDRHHANRHAFWSYVVRVVTALNAAFVVAQLVSSWAVIPAYLRIVLGQLTFPHHLLRLLNDGKEIALTGGFDFNTATDLQGMLDRFTSIRTIDLSSTGGFVAEAELVRKMIQDRNLATYTDGLCVSACTLAFIGGRSRYLGPHGKLGFHRYTLPGATPQQDDAANLDGQQSLLDAAIAPDFAARAFSIPYSDMWYPDAATLRAANVVTQTVDGRAFASTANGELGDDEIERILSGLPAFAALKQAERTAYDDAYQSIVAGAHAGMSIQQTWGKAESLLRWAETKYQARADDAIQRQLAVLMVLEGQFLSDVNPMACMMLFRTIPRTDPDYAAFLSYELEVRDKSVAAAIIRGGSTTPVTSLANDKALTMVADLWMQVRRSGFDLAALGRPPETADDRHYLCKALSAFMLGVTRLPSDQLGPLMRQLAGSPLGPVTPQQ